MDVWEVRKQILYGNDACSSHLQSQSLVGDMGGITGVDGQRSGVFLVLYIRSTKGKYMYPHP